MRDVVIIGGGVIGAGILRELTRYAVKAVLVEKEEDVASGASKANSAIVHAGYDCVPGTLMAKLNVEGNALFDQVANELEVPLKRCGSYVVAFGGEDEKELQKLKYYGDKNGVPGLQIISGEELRQREPSLNEEITAALYAPTGGITCPYELTVAYAENAIHNGGEVMMNFDVASVQRLEDGFVLRARDGREVRGKYVVNAAGVHADDISRLAGAEDFAIHPRKGEYMLLDKAAGGLLSSVIFQTPSRMGKGVLVSPTVDGNLFIGPTAVDQTDKEDREVTAKGIGNLIALGKKSVPKVPTSKVIRSFAGLRAVSGTDFRIEASGKAPGFIQVAGICSPGLSSAPAIALRVVDLLSEAGLALEKKPDFDPHRKHIRRFSAMTPKEQAEAVKMNPLYGRIICRCETVSEAEIVEAIHRPLPATSLDMIKRRTRAGMGRCQSGFCKPRVMEILSRELGIPMEEVTQSGTGSWIVEKRKREG